MKASVIVPVYNVGGYLRKCLDSILAQSYKDMEIVIVDDCSTDSSGKICDEYAAKDERITLVHHPENRGLSAARNTGLNLATGEVFFFIDSDDWIEKDMVKTGVEELEQNTDVDIVCFSYNRIYKSGKAFPYCTFFNSRKVEPEKAIEMTIDQIISIDVWNKCFRKSLFDNLRFPEGLIGECCEITFQLFDKARLVLLSTYIAYNFVFERADSIRNSQSDKLAQHTSILMKRVSSMIKAKYPRVYRHIEKEGL